MAELKTSGQQRQFNSGSVRDSEEGKAAMELLPFDLLMRVAVWYKMGADKYGVDNWRLGQPQRKVVGSLLRHLTKYMMGQDDEDHLAAVVWNALCLMHVDQYFRDNSDLFDAFGAYSKH